MSGPSGATRIEHLDVTVERVPTPADVALHAVASRSASAAPVAGGVARTVLREQVKELLIGRIIRGELGPGEPLVETRIAQELGTSQAPVREALRDLALLRLVEAEPFRSARVRRFSEQDVLDIYSVRAALDDLAARRTCGMLAGDVRILEVELEAMDEAARSGDRAGLIFHDLAFHRLILESAGNPALTQCWATLGVEAMLTLTIYRPMTDPIAVARSHDAIIEAMRSQRPATAGREARRHVELYAKLARQNRSAR
jgi:DNA-binding GntR family transcriptional regulator